MKRSTISEKDIALNVSSKIFFALLLCFCTNGLAILLFPLLIIGDSLQFQLKENRKLIALNAVIASDFYLKLKKNFGKEWNISDMDKEFSDEATEKAVNDYQNNIEFMEKSDRIYAVIGAIYQVSLFLVLIAKLLAT
jgi:hypothetical protein